MMISETPLPIPRLVICSPSHSRNMVPPTRLMTAPMRNMYPGSTTAAMPFDAPKLSRPAARNQPWIVHRKTVPYRVYWFSF